MKVYINNDNTVHYIGDEKIATDVINIIDIEATEQQLLDYSKLIFKDGELVEDTDIDLDKDQDQDEILLKNFLAISGIYNRTKDGLKFTTTNKDFESIVREQAQIIKNQDKNVHLMLSGGIDSVLVFYALVEAGVVFTVHFNELSEAEYPKLIGEIENGEFNNVTPINHTKTPRKFSEFDNKIVVTGEIGDQIFGSDQIFDHYMEQRNMPYKLVIPIEVWKATKPTTDLILEPKDTATTAQWMWCINFIYKFKKVNKRICKGFGVSKQELWNFFGAPDFQAWAMTHQLENSKYNKYTYKMPSRDYIFSQNGDTIYRDTKTKIGSLRSASYEKA